jgi:hypothetical protein
MIASEMMNSIAPPANAGIHGIIGPAIAPNSAESPVDSATKSAARPAC